jgi:hypothetical protein
MALQVILFENASFGGNHIHVFQGWDNIQNLPGDASFNDKTSSIVVVEGNWQFFKDWKWENPFSNVLAPGIYNVVEALGAGSNDSITGLRPVELVNGKWAPITVKTGPDPAPKVTKSSVGVKEQVR